jgi:hypothetical protein
MNIAFIKDLFWGVEKLFMFLASPNAIIIHTVITKNEIEKEW